MNGIVSSWQSGDAPATGSILQSPYACACAAILSGPSAIPISANGTLHDEVKACSIVTVDAPPAQNSSPKFSICVVVPGRLEVVGVLPGLLGRPVVVERGARRDRLERRARQVEVLEGVRHERLRRVGDQGLPRLLDLRVGAGRQAVRVIARVGVHREDVAGRRVDRDDRALVGAERLARLGLHLRHERRDHVPAALRPPEDDVGEVLGGELRRGAGEVGVHRLLEAASPVDARVVAGQLAPERATGVGAQELVRGAGVGVRLRLREHGRAVRGEDLAAFHGVLGLIWRGAFAGSLAIRSAATTCT